MMYFPHTGDFNTSRQLLILYTLVASRCKQGGTTNSNPSCHHTFQDDTGLLSSSSTTNSTKPKCRRLARQISSMSVHNELNTQVLDRKPSSIPSPPPPPPLDTDRLRSATNSDGLLAVLGAAEVLKSLQTGAASKRALEAAASIDE
jgi:type II secretory pathway component HofQ